MPIGILDLDMGNLGSVCNAIYNLGYDHIIIDQNRHLDDISHIILPGVGHFHEAQLRIKQKKIDLLLKAFIKQDKPFLGICLGMQILLSKGAEGGIITAGLDYISGHADSFNDQNIRIPHVGWNEVDFSIEHPVFYNIKPKRDFYFTHSYRAYCPKENIYATTPYNKAFPSIIGKDNVIGCQFHPEKSQKNGLKLLENFCEWDGRC